MTFNLATTCFSIHLQKHKKEIEVNLSLKISKFFRTVTQTFISEFAKSTIDEDKLFGWNVKFTHILGSSCRLVAAFESSLIEYNNE